MSKVMPGSYTAHIEGQFAVFNIGMRLNKLWAVHKWLLKNHSLDVVLFCERALSPTRHEEIDSAEPL